MGDLLLVAVVVVCFLGAASFVRACTWIVGPEDAGREPEPGALDEGRR